MEEDIFYKCNMEGLGVVLSKISGGEVLGWIVRRLNRYKNGNRLIIRVKWVVEEIGMSRTNVARQIKELERLEVIKRSKRDELEYMVNPEIFWYGRQNAVMMHKFESGDF